jgi:hypothetical protein
MATLSWFRWRPRAVLRTAQGTCGGARGGPGRGRSGLVRECGSAGGVAFGRLGQVRAGVVRPGFAPERVNPPLGLPSALSRAEARHEQGFNRPRGQRPACPDGGREARSRARTRWREGRRMPPGRRVRAGGLCVVVAANSFALLADGTVVGQDRTGIASSHTALPRAPLGSAAERCWRSGRVPATGAGQERVHFARECRVRYVFGI